MNQRESRALLDDAVRTVRIEHSTPIYRIVAVAMVAGAVFFLGWWLKTIGHEEDFATVAVIALIFTVSFWAQKRPDRLRRRFGPFGKIADAVRESQAEIRAWVYERTLVAGFGLSVVYGLVVVALKHLVVALIGAMYTWQVTVALGLIVGALVAAPSLFGSARARLALSDDDDEDAPAVGGATRLDLDPPDPPDGDGEDEDDGRDEDARADVKGALDAPSPAASPGSGATALSVDEPRPPTAAPEQPAPLSTAELLARLRTPTS